VTIHVDKDWWKHLFDEIYLQTDARSVCNEQLTEWEVDFLEQVLHADKTAPILDLCGGQGRHALELTRRGFTQIIVLDYSLFLVDLGRKTAGEETLPAAFIRGDGRYAGLRTGGTAAVVLMGNSFGYFVDDTENSRILDEAFRKLNPRGKLLLDLPDRDFVVRTLKPSASHTMSEGITVTRTRELRGNLVYSRETIASTAEGCRRDRTYCMHLYSREDISRLLGVAGFTRIAFEDEFMNRASEGDYGGMINRMIVMAEKSENV
jgi:D-alanine-D-alanine ligase